MSAKAHTGGVGATLRRRIAAINLRTKIAGLVALVVLASGFATWLVARANITAVMSQRLGRQALIVAQAAAAYYADAAADEDYVASLSLIQTLLDNDPEVLYAVVHAADGAVVVQAARPGAPPERLRAGVPQSEVAYRAELIAVAGPLGQVYEAAVPLAGRPGYVRAGLDQTALQSALAVMNRNAALAVAAVLLAAVTLAVALTQRLTRPLLGLQQAVRATSLNNLEPQTDSPADDEIGELILAFNRMTADLARSRDVLMAQNRELAVMNSTAQAVSGSLDLAQVLRAALSQVLDQLHLRAGWIFLAQPDQALAFAAGLPEPPANGAAPPPLELATHAGLSEAFARAEAGPDFSGCACLEVLKSGEGRVIHDICRECQRLSPETILAEGLLTHASIPLVARDRVVGVLNVAADRAYRFGELELRLLNSIGRQIGLAVDNARLWDQVRRQGQLRGQLLERLMAAQEDERRRIALVLHDQTGSSLASLGVGLRMLEDSAPLPRAARAQLRDLKEQVAQIARDLHRMALDLRPPALDRLGLAEAVEQCVGDFARQHALTADFQAVGLDDSRLPAEVETAVYRIVQEALTNVAKHARATEVGVVLERRLDSVVAVVEDNGRGFDVAAARAADDGSHLGLFGMQEHTAMVGGRWQVESAPGQGATVFVEVPVRPPASPTGL